jgi:hypothetical protein
MNDETRLAVAIPLSWVAWGLASNKDFEAARLAYGVAGQVSPRGHIDADISVLRHTVGLVNGYVEGVEATEDIVQSVWLGSPIRESPTSDGMSRIEGADLERNIRALMNWVNPGFHKRNIVEDLPHVMVLSTGRCGTMSLFKLFQHDGILRPHHTYWFNMSVEARLEMMCRIVSGTLGGEEICADWYSSRAAEWLSGRMIGVNHTDTIFAPLFAAMHPNARFVYLRRNPEAVIKSFYDKNQFHGQIQQLDYAFDPGFRFHIPDMDLRDRIAWYVDFTETFCRAMGRVVPFIEISADKLFAQDRDEIRKLLEFTGSDIDIDLAVEHFGTKINEKAHKCRS